MECVLLLQGARRNLAKNVCFSRCAPPSLFFILEFEHKIDILNIKKIFPISLKKVYTIHKSNEVKPRKPDPILMAHFLKSE